MQVSKITNNLYNIYPQFQYKNNIIKERTLYSTPLKTDTFEKSSAILSFGSKGIIFENNEFEKLFPRSFFRKLAQEGLPCAYTGIRMIPRADVDSLIKIQVLNKKSEVALKYLKPYKDSLYDDSIEKRIFNYLENEAKKHPDMKLQDLLKLKYNSAEKSLVSQQAKILDQIILMSRKLPKADYLKIRKLAQISFEKILAQDPFPEERFRRKDFLYALKELDISDEKIKQAMIHKAEKLPQSSNSINAFIVKYSQPYKFKINNEGRISKTARDSEDLVLRLLRPSIATDEHIYPQKLYRLEEIARQKGDEEASKLSDFKVTILTSEYINGLKEDMLFDDFVKSCKYDVKSNIKNHIDKLIERGFIFISPESGRLACGDVGVGKLAEPIDIVSKIIEILCPKQDFKGKKVLVTCGATREPIDGVRFITNKSSGKMGIEIAKAVELAFPGRKVKKVRTVYMPSHAKRVGYSVGRTQSGKKAIVTIEGDPIEELAGV